MAFENGVVIFFRVLDVKTNPPTLARSVHPDGRDVEIRGQYGHPEDYVVLNENNEIVGLYPRDWVACILPLQTQGPAANVADQSSRRDSAAPSAEGDTESVTGRAKRFNS